MKAKKATRAFNPRARIAGGSAKFIFILSLLKTKSRQIKIKKDFTAMLRK
jgi:hypothetical protein